MVSWLGHWHPLVLHFPIVLLLLALFLGLTGRRVPPPLLVVAVLSALVTAITGFFLGKETVVRGSLLVWHQWLGAAVAFVSVVWYALSNMGLGRGIFAKVWQVVLLGLIALTGHYGGMLTHGEDFLALPIDPKQREIPDNPVIYGDVVARILNDKCISCHNPNKQKGELLMTDRDALLKGGESGTAIVPGKPGESEMVKRLHLPMDNDGHMPPEGKTPLTDTEIGILERWIALGASDTLRLSDLKEPEPLIGLVKSLMVPDPLDKWAEFPKVADTTLLRLSSDYLTINRMAANAEALSVDVYLPPEYDPQPVVNLKRVAENIVELDLSGIPIGSEEIDFIATCTHLEWLELDKTPIGDDAIEKLADLKQLGLLKVYQTSIGDKSLSVFKRLPNLKKLYLWDTDVTVGALEKFKGEAPHMLVEDGIDPEIEAFFIAGDTTVIE
ncbi:Uncharacterized membrane protein [Pseudozobellia thermophila]|uniref:Uncharacterized membrane protein n=1 Tax=Pseudozobellia thermophila TaxID=192903 RepID=A0A1M6DAC2_9FLAO|nr:Uncharacterized membrane protein [Pseudozobellia thermophila]